MPAEQTGPLRVVPNAPRYTASVDIFGLPEGLQQPLRDLGRAFEHHCFDYQDGDYYFLLDFGLLVDNTPESVLTQVIADELDDEAYPQLARAKATPYDLIQYVQLLLVLRNIVSRVPPSIVAENKLAVRIWH